LFTKIALCERFLRFSQLRGLNAVAIIETSRAMDGGNVFLFIPRVSLSCHLVSYEALK